MNKILQAITNRRLIIHLFLGFYSGLPLLLIGSTLQAWMTEEKVDLTVIGLFSLVGLPYTLKFLWSPLLDRYKVPLLGRRRGWMLLSQLLLVLVVFFLGQISPSKSPGVIALISLFLAFFSSTQDIVIDAYRREVLSDDELGFGSSLYVSGYRIALLVSGAFALFLATIIPWSMVYFIMSAIMATGLIATVMAPNPIEEELGPTEIKEAIIGPFVEYFKRDGAFLILGFILFYKIGDSMAAHMTTPFILKHGFSKLDIATVAKTFGMLATIGGGLIGGLLMLRLGIIRSLWIFGIDKVSYFM